MISERITIATPGPGIQIQLTYLEAKELLRLIGSISSHDIERLYAFKNMTIEEIGKWRELYSDAVYGVLDTFITEISGEQP
jgi:hypothetical protein